jgi:hypothetical protein
MHLDQWVYPAIKLLANVSAEKEQKAYSVMLVKTFTLMSLLVV